MDLTQQGTLQGKQGHIVHTLRSEIVGGAAKPGSRLPTQAELAKRFGTSGATVQHALKQLIREGFISAQPRRGTFVADDPPHLCHYGILFHSQPSVSSTWQQFWVALEREAALLREEGRRRLSMFYGIHGWAAGKDMDRLVDLVVHHRLAGLIFTSDPYHIEGSPLIAEPRIPRVAITFRKSEAFVSVVLDSCSLWQRWVDVCRARDAKQVGVLVTPKYSCADMKAFFEERGLKLRPELVQAVRLEDAEWASNAVQLMLHADRECRPEVLIIADDNLVPHATAGIAASGVSVPSDVEVLAHTNFPWPTPSSVPVRRFGYDVRRVLQTCIDLIDQMRAERAVPAQVVVPAIWEEELASARAAEARPPDPAQQAAARERPGATLASSG